MLDCIESDSFLIIPIDLRGCCSVAESLMMIQVPTFWLPNIFSLDELGTF
jgi:hypothetical protein